MSAAITLTLVAAVAQNSVMGRDGVLPWYLPGDLKHFRQTTKGHPLLMGRRTYQSIGRPLPGRESVVLTRDLSFAAKGIHVVHDMAAGLDLASKLAVRMGVDEIMVVGGGELYAELIDMASRLIITEIAADVKGDVVFPLIDPVSWHMTTCSGPQCCPGDEFIWRHATYTRIAAHAALAYKATP